MGFIMTFADRLRCTPLVLALLPHFPPYPLPFRPPPKSPHLLPHYALELCFDLNQKRIYALSCVLTFLRRDHCGI